MAWKTTVRKGGKTYRVERNAPSEGGTKLVEVKKETSSKKSSSGGSSSNLGTTTILKDGVKTTIVRRSASEGGSYAYETTKSDPLPTNVKGVDDREKVLQQVRQQEFNKLSSKRKQEEISKIETANEEAQRQQAEFVQNNPYGYTSTSGQLVGSTDPNALNRNLIVEAGQRIREERKFSRDINRPTAQEQGLEVYTDDSGRYGYSTTEQAYKVSQTFAPNYVASNVTGGVLTRQQANESAQDNRFIRRLKVDIAQRTQNIQTFGQRPLIEKTPVQLGFNSQGVPQYGTRYDFNILRSGWLGLEQARDRVVLFGAQVTTQPGRTASQFGAFAVQTVKAPLQTGGSLWTGLKTEYLRNPVSFISGGALETYTGTKAFNLVRRGASSTWLGRYVARTTQRVKTARTQAQFETRLPTPTSAGVFETPNFKEPSFQAVPNLYDTSAYKGVTVQTVQGVQRGGFDVPRVPRAFTRPDGTVNLKNPFTLPTQGRQVQLSPREFNPIQNTNSEFLLIRQRLERDYSRRSQTTLQNFGVENPVPSQTRAGLYYLDTRTTGLYRGFQRQTSVNEFSGVTVQRPGQGVKRFYMMAIPFPIPDRTINIGSRSFRKFESEFKIFGQGSRSIAEKLDSPPTQVSRDIPLPFKSIGSEPNIQTGDTVVFNRRQVSPIQEIVNRGERVRSASVSSLNIINRQSSPIAQNIINRTRSSSSQVFRQRQNQEQSQTLIQIPKFKPSQAQTPRQNTLQRTQKNTLLRPERILPIKPFRPPTSSPRQERGFNVLTRKGGVFIQANPLSLSRSEALNFGSNLVKTTARASFKIVETDSPAQGRYRTRGSLLNLEKRRGGVYVEPSKFRINTAGELDQITRKGQKARRSKKRKGWLGL